jgi:hypothetical protein
MRTLLRNAFVGTPHLQLRFSSECERTAVDTAILFTKQRLLYQRWGRYSSFREFKFEFVDTDDSTDHSKNEHE